MRDRIRGVVVLSLLVATASGIAAAAGEVTLHQITFPERRNVDVEFGRTAQAPAATLKAEVKIREGQAQIEVKYRDMKPAILFGGDVTSYVLWAISRDGNVENLGELWVRETDDKLDFATGMKGFALLVTGEAYPLVTKPSSLVLFTSTASSDKKAPSTPFLYSDLQDAPAVGMDSIAHISWDSSQPVDLMQAEKAYELARREGGEEYTAQIMREAGIALSQAKNFSTTSSRRKELIDYSRRAVSLFGEAIQLTKRRKEREAIEKEIEKRRKEMQALEARAHEAEKQAAVAQEQLALAEEALAKAALQKKAAEEAIAQTQGELSRLGTEKATLEQQQQALQLEKDQLLSERDALRTQKETLEADRNSLLAEKTSLEQEKLALVQQQQELQQSVSGLEERMEKLRKEREQLAARLEGALSQVAETRDSARGFIVNLPDILFDLNEATLKHEARVVIAKLSGILLIMPELNLRVEGHTDATGSDEYNQGLSERRAASVRDFLAAQGINMNRMVAVGYGEKRPVADNETKEGRQKNRRVEIIISEGTVAEAPG